MKKIVSLMVVVFVLCSIAVPAMAYTPPSDAVKWTVRLRWDDTSTNIPFGETVTLYNSKFNGSESWADYAGQELIFTRNSDEMQSGSVDTSVLTLYAVTGADWAICSYYEDYWECTDGRYTVTVAEYDAGAKSVTLSIVGTGEVVPPESWALSGGYYITCDSALGESMTFYVPAEYASGSLTYDENGNLFNLTDNSIYLYSPDYPGYTIYASRFSVFQYRTEANYGSSLSVLNLHNVTDTNVQIFENNPSKAYEQTVDFDFMFDLIGLVLLVLIFLRMGRL